MLSDTQYAHAAQAFQRFLLLLGCIWSENVWIDLPAALARAARAGDAVLVDSLDFWVFACIEAGKDRLDELEAALAPFAGPDGPGCVLVSCEVGLGPLGATPFVRRFVRSLGAVNQRLATLADGVVLAVAGLSLPLKGGEHVLL